MKTKTEQEVALSAVVPILFCRQYNLFIVGFRDSASYCGWLNKRLTTDARAIAFRLQLLRILRKKALKTFA
jgi:hypothetical protein